MKRIDELFKKLKKQKYAKFECDDESYNDYLVAREVQRIAHEKGYEIWEKPGALLIEKTVKNNSK